MLVSLMLILAGLLGIFAFPPSVWDETWLRFFAFVSLALGGCLMLLVSAIACLVAAIMAWRRREEN